MVDSIRGKRAFITGADGFIGSHLVEELVKGGATVRAMVFYNSWNERGWLRELPRSVLKEVEIFVGDVRDVECIKKGVSHVEYVFHLASLIAIPYSYQAPRSYVETNIGGAMNVLQACRESECLTRLVHLSTSEVYGSAQQLPISESHPLVGQSPYSASKIGADKLAESFHLSFGLPVVTARPFNTFGPRQTARAVIPTIASQLLSGRLDIELGALNPTRDFTFVKDTVRALLALGCCSDAEGKAVNIGTGFEWSIRETVELLCELVGIKANIKLDHSRLRPEKSEVNRLLADTSLIKELTSWRSEVTFREGLLETLEWIGNNLNYFDTERYMR